MDLTALPVLPVQQLASVFLTTTVAPAVATVVCMIFTWVKYGKPDVSMCLNASLAGLVAITAPCDVTDCFGAICHRRGFRRSGLHSAYGSWIMYFAWTIPVGAVAVHFMNGMWGTIAVGLFRYYKLLREMTTPDWSLLRRRIAALLGKQLTRYCYR